MSGLTDVSELVELVDGHEHLGDVESGVFLLEHTRVVEQSSEIASRDVLLQVAIARTGTGQLAPEQTAEDGGAQWSSGGTD